MSRKNRVAKVRAVKTTAIPRTVLMGAAKEAVAENAVAV